MCPDKITIPYSHVFVLVKSVTLPKNDWLMKCNPSFEFSLFISLQMLSIGSHQMCQIRIHISHSTDVTFVFLSTVLFVIVLTCDIYSWVVFSNAGSQRKRPKEECPTVCLRKTNLFGF